MDLGISGKTALVTASSKGLGRASALALAAEGANVVICARGEDDLRRTEAEIAAAGAEVLAVPADVTEGSVPQQLTDSAVERFGGLDILVANAGGPPPGRALDIDDESIAAAVNGNLTTSIRLARAAIPHMRSNGWGRICMITSFSIKQPIPDLALSNLARTGLWAWSKTAAQDLFADGITLNHICPGLHATDRVKALGHVEGPLGDPEDFGKVVAFLCSQQANFISGAALQVDATGTRGLL